MTYQMPTPMPMPQPMSGYHEFAPSAPPAADVPPSYNSVTSYPDIGKNYLISLYLLTKHQ